MDAAPDWIQCSKTRPVDRVIHERVKSSLSISFESILERFCTAHIVPLIVFQVFTRTRVLQPTGVLNIPINGAADPFLEGNLRFPSEFALDLGTVQGIAAVMSRAVLHVFYERFRFPQV